MDRLDKTSFKQEVVKGTMKSKYANDEVQKNELCGEDNSGVVDVAKIQTPEQQNSVVNGEKSEGAHVITGNKSVQKGFEAKRKRTNGDSDSDFEKKTTKLVGLHVKHRVVRGKIKAGPRSKVTRKMVKSNVHSETTINANLEENELFPRIRIRTSPKPLFVAARSLKDNQKKCLLDMGLGPMMLFNIDGLPSKLGHYVVDKFNENKMEIKVGDASILVTEEAIFDMLGVRMGGVRLGSVTGGNLEDQIIEQWMDQYGKKEVTAVDIKNQIISSTEVNWNFKLNFIMLFINTMGGCKTRGKCDLSMLPYLIKDGVLHEIDWCHFLVSCVKKCKSGWNGSAHGGYFAGPLTLLTLLYVDATKCSKPTIVRQRPAFLSWTYELMKIREDVEIASGGFGMGELCPPYELSSCDAQIVGSDEAINDIEVCLDAEVPLTVKDYIFKMEALHGGILKDLVLLEATMRESMTKFPEDVEVAEWRLKITSMWNPIDTRGGCNVGDENDRCAPNEKPTSFEMGKKIDGSTFQTPVVKSIDANEQHDEGQLSQYWFDPELHEMVDMAVERSLTRSKRVETIDHGIPSFSLGLTQEFDNASSKQLVSSQIKTDQQIVVDAKPVSSFLPTKDTRWGTRDKGKRVATLSYTERSPFLQRLVDVKKRSTTEETKVWNHFKSCAGMHTDIVFATKDGQLLSRDSLESLAEGAWVFPDVIDCWTALLNIDEAKRSMDTPSRLFCHSGIMTEDMLADKIDAHARLKKFTCNFGEVVNGDPDLRTLKNVDLVFFPILQIQHYYLVCFNLKTPAVEIIDNTCDMFTNEQKYKTVPEKLQITFVDYLKMVGHVKCFRMSNAKPTRMEMKWRTVKNRDDSGVFVMRHMESYIGEPAKKWDCKIALEGRSQKAQLTRLRRKYVTKFLLSDHNIQKSQVLEDAEAYTNEN